jgi:hypothetical protein
MANLIQIPNCIGVDCSIKSVQTVIYESLQKIWSANWNCYPRVYKNKKYSQENGYFFVPEFLQGNHEYTTDTLFDDTVDVVSYFLVDDNRPFNEDNTTVEVSLIFSCLIDKLYDRPQKPDEEMHRDIINVLNDLPPTWEKNRMSTGVDEVYREFIKNGLNYSDMSNRHLVRFDFDVVYDYNC